MSGLKRRNGRRWRVDGSRWRGAGSLGLTCIAIVIHFGGLAPLLEYKRDAIAAGQLWRVVTGHWTHWSGSMLLWDAAAFCVLGVIGERTGWRRFAVCVAFSAVAISATLWFAFPQFEHYRGLSGIDSALFVLLTVEGIARSRRQGARGMAAMLIALLVLFGGKLIYEYAAGAALFVQNTAGFTTLPAAHLVGALAGGGVAWVSLWLGRRARRTGVTPAGR